MLASPLREYQRVTPPRHSLCANRCIFFVIVAVLLCARAQDVDGDKLSAHAACTTIQALSYIDQSEALLLEEEKSGVDASVSQGMSPIAVGETLHENLSVFLDGAVATLRLALVSGAITEAAELAEFSFLETQFDALLSAQGKEKLFFWHGPRRTLLPRLRHLLRGSGVHDRLTRLATDCAKVKASLQPSNFFGTSAGAAHADATIPKTLVHGLPPMAIALGDANCGEGEECDLKGILKEARGFNGGGKIHVLVLPCSLPALQNIGAALRGVPDLWLSLAIAAPEDPSQRFRLQPVLNQVLRALGQKSVDLLWLPYEVFPKPVWTGVQQEVQMLLKKGVLGAYGVHGNLGNQPGVVTKIFEGRQPAPAAWLVPHDVLRPLEAQAAAEARRLNIALVARSRPEAFKHRVATAFLEAARGLEPLDLQAVHYRWILQSGFGLAMQLSGGDKAVLSAMLDSKVSEDGSRILDTIRFVSETSKADGHQLRAHSQGLEQTVHFWRRKIAESASPSVDNLGVASSSGKNFAPGVNDHVLTNLEQQAKEYKANNRVIYKPDFFDEATYAAILNETQRLWRSEDVEGNCNLDGINRLGGYVLDHGSRDSSLYKLIYGNEKFRRWVSAVNDEGDMWPSDFPIEIREYGDRSKGMQCHSDLQMYAVPKKDLEFAVTVDNLSRCNVVFYDAQNKKHQIHTKGNSVMMVRVNAARHCVLPTEGGHRTILKFIYVGDYRKSKEFGFYKGNECGADNPNNIALRARREKRTAEWTEL